jgi:hypothetical protein
MGRWPDPLPTTCPSCGRRSPVPLAELQSLRAVCLRCGASLASVGELLLAKQAWLRTEIDRAVAEVWAELEAEDAAGDSVQAKPNVAPERRED